MPPILMNWISQYKSKYKMSDLRNHNAIRMNELLVELDEIEKEPFLNRIFNGPIKERILLEINDICKEECLYQAVKTLEQ